MEEFSKLENPQEDKPDDKLEADVEVVKETESREVPEGEVFEAGETPEELEQPLEEYIEGTKQELNQARQDIDLPLTQEHPPSTAPERELLENIRSEKVDEGQGESEEPASEEIEPVESVPEEEKGPETIPTMEEVRSVFEQLIGGESYEDIKVMEDDQGLYLWEIKVGDDTEYSYMRKGTYEQGGASETKIYVVYTDNGLPIGGDEVAKYDDGEWQVY